MSSRAQPIQRLESCRNHLGLPARSLHAPSFGPRSIEFLRQFPPNPVSFSCWRERMQPNRLPKRHPRSLSALSHCYDFEYLHPACESQARWILLVAAGPSQVPRFPSSPFLFRGCENHPPAPTLRALDPYSGPPVLGLASYPDSFFTV